VFLTQLLLASGCDDCDPIKPKEPDRQPEWHLLGLENEDIHALELDYPYLYACAGSSGLFRVDVTEPDLGWSHLGLSVADFPTAKWGGLGDAIVLPGNVILAASSYATGSENLPGLHRSLDGGVTWARSDTGITRDGGRVCRITCFAACDHYVFAGTIECGFYRSIDAGQHWELGGCNATCASTQDWIGPSSADCSIIWQVKDHFEGQSVSVSQDHGDTWDYLPLGIFLESYEMALDPYDANVAYIGTRDSVVKTEDLGSSFETVLHMPEGARTWGLAHGESTGHVFVLAGLYHRDTETLEHLFYELHCAEPRVDTLSIPIPDYARELLYDDERQTLYVAAKGGVYAYQQ
jgi:hypothetical protein